MKEYICLNLPKLINASGLIFDIIGVLILWKFGLPESISKTGAQFIITEEANEEEIAKAVKYDAFAGIGLIFIITGFILQFISLFV